SESRRTRRRSSGSARSPTSGKSFRRGDHWITTSAESPSSSRRLNFRFSGPSRSVLMTGSTRNTSGGVLFEIAKGAEATSGPSPPPRPLVGLAGHVPPREVRFPRRGVGAPGEVRGAGEGFRGASGADARLGDGAEVRGICPPRRRDPELHARRIAAAVAQGE